MDFKSTKVYNFEGALRGMRNPLNSWDKSDSYCGIASINNPPSYDYDVAHAWVEHEAKLLGEKTPNFSDEKWSEIWDKYDEWLLESGILSFNGVDKYHSDTFDVAYLGPNDLGLAQRLINAGPEHAKFLRQIFVSVDITAPLYWWKEADTYKVATTANSTSTMHKLMSKEFGREDFEFDDNEGLPIFENDEYRNRSYGEYIDSIIKMCNHLRNNYLDTEDKRYWRALVQILPNAYLQTRTWTANYAILRNIYFQRKNHKLREWYQFCKWIKNLPYSGELITLGE